MAAEYKEGSRIREYRNIGIYGLIFGVRKTGNRRPSGL
jgi:hypothetical protein